MLAWACTHGDENSLERYVCININIALFHINEKLNYYINEQGKKLTV